MMPLFSIVFYWKRQPDLKRQSVLFNLLEAQTPAAIEQEELMEVILIHNSLEPHHHCPNNIQNYPETPMKNVSFCIQQEQTVHITSCLQRNTRFEHFPTRVQNEGSKDPR